MPYRPDRLLRESSSYLLHRKVSQLDQNRRDNGGLGSDCCRRSALGSGSAGVGDKIKFFRDNYGPALSERTGRMAGSPVRTSLAVSHGVSCTVRGCQVARSPDVERLKMEVATTPQSPKRPLLPTLTPQHPLFKAFRVAWKDCGQGAWAENGRSRKLAAEPPFASQKCAASSWSNRTRTLLGRR